MNTARTLPTALIINTSDDYLEIMRLYLNSEGYVTIPVAITDIKTRAIDIVQVIEEHDPQVVLYDIAFPYRENWRQCQNVMSLEVSQGREFILTTPNIDALSDMVGQQIEAFEVVDKEIDLRKIVDKVKSVWPNSQRGS